MEGRGQQEVGVGSRSLGDAGAWTGAALCPPGPVSGGSLLCCQSVTVDVSRSMGQAAGSPRTRWQCVMWGHRGSYPAAGSVVACWAGCC